MDNYRNILREAYRAHKQKRHAESIALIEKILPSATSEPYAAFLLAVQYLHVGMLHKSDALIHKALASHPSYTPLARLDAFIFMKSAGNAAAAIGRYAEQSQRHPDDRYLSKGLRKIRSASSFEEFQKNSRMADLVPVHRPPGRPLFRRKKTVRIAGTGRHSRIRIAALTVVIAVLCAGLAVSVLVITEGMYCGRLTGPSGLQDARAVDSLSIEGGRHALFERLSRRKTPVFYYSNAEITESFNRARMLTKKGEYDEALKLVNGILNSNATMPVKEKAEFLHSVIMSADNRIPSLLSYDEAARESYLYRGYLVKWKGKAANIAGSGNRLTFDLLTGYKKHDIFSGIVGVVFSGNRELKNGDLVTVTGTLSAVEGATALVLMATGIDVEKRGDDR